MASQNRDSSARHQRVVVLDASRLPPLTREQARVVERIVSGFGSPDPRRCFVVRALAGAGKTTVIDHVHVRLATKGKSVIRLTFNRSLAKSHGVAETLHGLIYRHTGFDRARLEQAPSPAWAVRRFGIASASVGHRDGTVSVLQAEQVAAHALAAAQRWMTSTAPVPGPEHLVLPEVPPNADAGDIDALRATVLAYATLIADDMLDVRSSAPITHDTYIRWWWQRGGLLAADAVVFDEAQDASALMLDLVLRSSACVLVGDPYQGIYDWRSAIGDFGNEQLVPRLAHKEVVRLDMVHSFRFDTERAVRCGNAALVALQADVRLRRAYESERPVPERPRRAVLARTRAGVLAAAEYLLGRGEAVTATQVEALGRAFDDVRALREGVSRGRFALFAGWRDFELLADADPHSEYAGWVRLFRRIGEDRLARLVQRLRDLSAHSENEGTLPVTVTTVHQAKGLEWDCVQLIDDWPEGMPCEWNDPQRRLWYVACTRARFAVRLPSRLHPFLAWARQDCRQEMVG